MSGEREYVLRSNRTAVTRLLALIVDIMDTLLEDWYVFIYMKSNAYLCAAFEYLKDTS